MMGDGDGGWVPREDFPHPRVSHARDEAGVRGAGGKHRQGSRTGARFPCYVCTMSVCYVICSMLLRLGLQR